MMAVARLVRDRRREVARTLRETFGVGLSDLGDGLKWGEALTLLEAAISDTSTHLGAAIAGWAYPASVPALIQLSATVRDERAMRGLWPWQMRVGSDEPAASDEEIAAAQAELDAGIVFSG